VQGALGSQEKEGGQGNVPTSVLSLTKALSKIVLQGQRGKAARGRKELRPVRTDHQAAIVSQKGRERSVKLAEQASGMRSLV